MNAKIETFAVPGIAGAHGYADVASGHAGRNISFAKGVYVYTVGQELATGETYDAAVAKLVGAAQSLHGRVSR